MVLKPSAPTSRRVSVIVPTRNRPDLLKEALASIRALETPGLSFEILIGDNGTDPNTIEIARKFGAIHLRADGEGSAGARNVAFAAATGEFVAFLDDDDVWQATHIHNHVALMDANPEIDCVFGQVTLTDESLTPILEPGPDRAPADNDFVRAMLQGWFPQIGATVARTSVRDTIGMFDEVLIGDQDWDWHIRNARTGRVGFVAVPSVLFRSRPDGSYDKLQRKRVRFTRKVFLRHAWPERRRWSSPKTWISSYYYCFQYYYAYFAEAAEERARNGRPLSALYAGVTAIWLFPRMAIKHLTEPSALRGAFATLIGLGPRNPNKNT